MMRCYRDLMNTIVDLFPYLFSIVVLILLIYYCFAIIGMEFLVDKVHQGCCKNALFDVGVYYEDNITNVSSSNVYYINNFNNILRSYGKFAEFIFLAVTVVLVVMLSIIFVTKINIPKQVSMYAISNNTYLY